MQAAIEEAQKGVSAGDGGPFGAVIVKDGEIIAKAHNEVVKENDPTAHAEIVAIRRASARLGTYVLGGCVLYTTGEPCPMCFSAIHWAHIDKVYYCNTKEDAEAIGFDDAFITKVLCKEIPSPIPFVRLSSNSCRKLFIAWYTSPNKKPY